MSQFKEGSVKELWKVSYPMMISFFSMMLMIFVDRLFLSWYSSEALNANVQAGTLAWAVIVGWMTMATMSEVFVAQFNGAKKYDELGTPVWQMVWLSLASYLFYLPLAIWGTPLIYDRLLRPEEFQYFQILMYFGPSIALVSAFGGFFMGRGKTQILQWMAILGNVVNIILDPIFIFGIDGFFPSLGVAGAAIATGLGNVIQVVILLALFLTKKNRERFKTHLCRINFDILFKTIRIGLPPSTLVCFELLGWALFYHWMAQISTLHIFVASVCQSILILFFFFGMGLEKGVIAMTGNFIGAKQPEKVKKVFFSGLTLLGIYSVIVLFLFVVFPDFLMNWFMSDPSKLENGSLLAGLNMEEVRYYIRIGLFYSALLIFFENIRWVINGILTAAGDTLFLLVTGALSVWFVLLVPTYFFIVQPKNSITYAFVIWIVYGIFASGLVFMRFLYGNWQKKEILEEKIDGTPEQSGT